MLPLRAALAEPSVVRELQQEIGLRRDMAARVVREDVLEADDRRRDHRTVAPPQTEGRRPVAGRETVADRGQPTEEGQLLRERDVFAEDDQATLPVDAIEAAVLGGHDRGIVEARLAVRADVAVIGSEDPARLGTPDEIGHRRELVGLEPGQESLGPDEHVGLRRDGLARQVEGLLEPRRAGRIVPDELLRDARLDQREADRGHRPGTVARRQHPVEADADDDEQGDQRQPAFRDPGEAAHRTGDDEQQRSAERHRAPADDEGHAVDSGDAGDLDQRAVLPERHAEEVPGESREQSRLDHLQRHPEHRDAHAEHRAPEPWQRGEPVDRLPPRAFIRGRHGGRRLGVQAVPLRCPRSCDGGRLAPSRFGDLLDETRRQPDPRAGEEREVAGQREPTGDRTGGEGDVQQPTHRDQPAHQTGGVAQPERGRSGQPDGAEQQRAGHEPGEAGPTGRREGEPEQQAREQGKREARTEPCDGGGQLQRGDVGGIAGAGRATNHPPSLHRRGSLSSRHRDGFSAVGLRRAGRA